MQTKMKRLVTCTLMALVVAGCAGRTPRPVTVAQVQDAQLSCAAIQAQIEGNNRQIAQLGEEEGVKVAQNVAAGVAGLFIWPIWLLMDFQDAAGKEIAALEQRNSYLGTLAVERCAGQ